MGVSTFQDSELSEQIFLNNSPIVIDWKGSQNNSNRIEGRLHD